MNKDVKLHVSKIILFALVFITCFQLGKYGVVILFFMFYLELISFLNNRKRLNRIYFSPNFLLFVGWLIFAFAQLLWVEHTSKTFGHVQSLMFGIVIIWMIITLVKTFNDLKYVYEYWGYCLLLTLAVAGWELVTGNHLYSSTYNNPNVLYYATVKFANPNDYSFFLGISLPIIFYWVRSVGWKKWIGLIMLFSSLYIVHVNNTRSVLLIFVLFIILYLLKERNFKLWLTFSLSVVLSSVYFNEEITRAFRELSSINISDNSLNYRLILIENAINVFKANPLLGVGSGNLEFYMLTRIKNVHNFWFEILVNYGLVLFLIICIFFISSLWKMYQQSKNNKMADPILWSVILFIPLSTTSSSIFQFFLTWFIFGLMIAVCQLNKYSIRTTKQSEDTVR